MIRRIAAHFVFPVSSSPIAKGMIEVDHDGTIVSLVNPEGELREMAGMVFHNGIICPGFIDLFREFPSNKLFERFPRFRKYEAAMPIGRTGDQGILEWMKTIQLSVCEISLEELFRLFILEPAKVLKREDELGTLDPGKRPGILLIDRMDYRNLRLSQDSRVKKLI
jgi:cytosine/adenosine deaminase-related metal-dependent hydrolase